MALGKLFHCDHFRQAQVTYLKPVDALVYSSLAAKYRLYSNLATEIKLYDLKCCPKCKRRVLKFARTANGKDYGPYPVKIDDYNEWETFKLANFKENELSRSGKIENSRHFQYGSQHSKKIKGDVEETIRYLQHKAWIERGLLPRREHNGSSV